MTKIECPHCATTFAPRVPGQRFCKPICSQRWWAAERSRAMQAFRQQQREQAEQAEDGEASAA